MINKLLFVLIISCIVNSELSFGHGEDQPGPHGGHIRMPGAFHTELLVEKNNLFRVYLLDINWKNPTTKNSYVQFRINSDKNLIQCKVIKNYFQCQPTQTINLAESNTITINAKRNEIVGSEAIYEFPLKTFGHVEPMRAEKIKNPAKSNPIDHSKHH